MHEKSNKFKHNQFTVTKLRDKIWHVTCKKQYDLAMLFLRSQEYYESPLFRNQNFALLEFLDWYAKEFDNSFYTQDWIGFNIPSWAVFESVYHAPDRNHWDDAIESIAARIGCEEDFYIIGTVEDDHKTLQHELAHGLFFTDEKYRKIMTQMVKALPDLKELKAILREDYNSCVFIDEAQAYLATGLDPHMKQFRKWQKPFQKVFNETLYFR